MKKALSLISILLIIAMFAACQTNKDELSKNDLPDILDATNEKAEAQSTKEQKTEELPTEAQPIEKEPVKYVMYADYAASVGENSSIDAERSDIEMKHATQDMFNILSRTFVEEPLKDLNETKKIKILNDTYEVVYARSYKTVFSSANDKKISEHIHQYTANKLVVEFWGDTNKISIFMNSSIDKKAEGNLTADQAEAKAKQIVEALYGTDVTKNYTVKVSLNETKDEHTYNVTYERYVHGFKTDDRISLTLNMKGELFGIGATKYGTVSNAEQDLTKEEIENAIKAVNENFSSSWNISSDHYIVIDSNGDYYLRSNLARNLDKFPFAMQIFTNIQ